MPDKGEELYRAVLAIHNARNLFPSQVREQLRDALDEYEWAALEERIQRSPAVKKHNELISQLQAAVAHCATSSEQP